MSAPSNSSFQSSVIVATEEEFSEGEKIFAHHQALIYEAKILKVSVRPQRDQPKETTKWYLIHYQGWNDRWDEWVETNRMLKFTDENKKIQEETKAEHKRKSTNTKKKSTEGKAKKRKYQEKEVIHMKCKIDVPNVLKKKLGEDWEFITCQKYLTVVPRKPSVADLMELFAAHLQESKIIIPKIDELTTDFKIYFDKALGTFLLYRFERDQYRNILQEYPDQTLSQLYGFEHLLRLCEVDDELLQLVKSFISHLVNFMAANESKFSSPQCYEPASPQYIRANT